MKIIFDEGWMKFYYLNENKYINKTKLEIDGKFLRGDKTVIIWDKKQLLKLDNLYN